MGNKFHLAQVSIYLAETALWERGYTEAERWLAQSLSYGCNPRLMGSAVVNCLFVAARLAVARQHYQRASVLFGLAEATRYRTHYTLVEPVRDQVNGALAVVRTALDPVLFAESLAAGQQLSITQAFTTILLETTTAITGSTRTERLANHLLGRLDQTILSTEPTFPEDLLVNSLVAG